MHALEWVGIFLFIAMLIFAIILIYNFYLCDNETCQSFIDAEKEAPVGSKDYELSLVESLGSDGLWPLPYVGSILIAAFSFWAIGVTPTVGQYIILFLVTFLVNYCLFTFFVHHYIKPITGNVSKYIEDICPNTV